MNELCKGRVLIVDDDLRFPENLKQTFEQRGLLVRAAEGQGEALRESARRMVREFRPHVTIMDLRLLEGQKPPDLSGIALIDEPDFAFTRCVVYSGHLGDDHILARDLKDRENVDDVVGRQEFSRLVSAVQKSFSRRCACCELYTVKWPKVWKPESVVEALFGKGSGVPPDLILDVLGRLFPKGVKLSLETLEGAATTAHSVARGHSVLLRANIPDKVSSVIKLAPRDRILKEVAAYDLYVDESLGGSYHVEKKGGRTFWDVGAIRYKFVGSPEYPVRTLADFYRSGADADSVLKPLRHFFEVVWRPHYMNSRAPLEESLFDAYDRALGLRERLEELRGAAGASAFPGAPAGLPDPIEWVLDYESYSGAFKSHQAVTHGDLHGDNMFVEGDHAWAIDFERTGPGPILRDFVEIEQDIITRLMQAGEHDFDMFFNFTLALTTPRTVSDPLPLQVRGEHLPEEARRAGAVISGLREIAVTVTGFRDMREYYWGLLLDALLGSSLTQPGSPQRKKCMLLAAVVASCLKHWNERWPPDWARPQPPPGRGGQRRVAADEGRPPACRYEVFLSYNSKDSADVRRFVQLLRDREVDVWYDEDLPPGASWVRTLEERLTHSRIGLICLGPHGPGRWQEGEEEFIVNRRIKGELLLIPVKLPGCVYADDLPGFLGLSQACDFSGGLENEAEFEKLLNVIYSS